MLKIIVKIYSIADYQIQNVSFMLHGLYMIKAEGFLRY